MHEAMTVVVTDVLPQVCNIVFMVAKVVNIRIDNQVLYYFLF